MDQMAAAIMFSLEVRQGIDIGIVDLLGGVAGQEIRVP